EPKEPPVKRKKGRPAGSKNKPKVDASNSTKATTEDLGNEVQKEPSKT
ncbi:MAG: hypothetical protein JJE21_07990, partial [Spirochaetaceae bacterium]|nr:hypothetical protein [Spirochaetaceae bacterium]